mmetsp:Transcript_34017/g.59285  ORF Transcript_34017/g.59285 Transcript_34017/m.59285 type:complete len:282 (+) Transcript_34017:2559-3404(+)
MEPNTAAKDSFLQEMLRRSENFSQKLVQLSPSNYTKEARELKEILDEQLSNTEELIELYKKQLAGPTDPLHDIIKLILTANYVSNPAIRLQLTEDTNDEHKVKALLDFWEVFNGNKGEKFQTVFARAVEYVDLYRRRSEVLAPNSTTSLKSLNDFVDSASAWLANKSKVQFVKKDISIGLTPEDKAVQLQTSTAATSIVPEKPKAEVSAPKRKSWADEEDDVPPEEVKTLGEPTMSDSQGDYQDEGATQGEYQHGRFKRNYNRGHNRRANFSRGSRYRKRY